jgi:hypothetical protein
VALEFAELDALKEIAIRRFKDRLANASPDKSIGRPVSHLRADLEHIYRTGVLLQKNEPSMERATGIWRKVAAIADEFAEVLFPVAWRRRSYRTSYFQILKFRAAAEERRLFHTKA